MTVTIELIIVFISSFIRAVSGFGYALISASLLTLVMDARSVVVLTILLGFVSNFWILIPLWRHIDIRKSILLSVGGIAGIPIGSYILYIIDPSFLKLLIACVVVPFAILLWRGHSYRFRHEIPVYLLAGFAGGILGASTSMGGPPLVLLLLNQGLSKEKFATTIACYFAIAGVANIGAYISLDLITLEHVRQALILLPALVFGSFAGIKLLPKLEQELFRKIAIGIVALSACSIIISYITEVV